MSIYSRSLFLITLENRGFIRSGSNPNNFHLGNITAVINAVTSPSSITIIVKEGNNTLATIARIGTLPQLEEHLDMVCIMES